LREMLMPWWDKAITETTFPLACKTADKKRWTRVFVGAIIDGKGNNGDTFVLGIGVSVSSGVRVMSQS